VISSFVWLITRGDYLLAGIEFDANRLHS
jgi:hypothetical protein